MIKLILVRMSSSMSQLLSSPNQLKLEKTHFVRLQVGLYYLELLGEHIERSVFGFQLLQYDLRMCWNSESVGEGLAG